MKAIEKTLITLESCLQTGSYQSIETERVELKDLSTKGRWQSFYETVCAFLNTEGGIVIIGVNEKGKSYHFTGYDENNEGKLKELPRKFTNDQGQELDLSGYFPSFEIHDLFGGRVCVVYVDKLPEDEKYIFYQGKAYERKLTGDHEIAQDRLEQQQERKEDLRTARELEKVTNAALADLDVDKLNDYLTLLNKDVKIEALKPDIQTALSFLVRSKFVRDNAPTLLGMLVCGNNLYDFIAGRCEVDGYIDSASQIAQDKKLIKRNIIPLMEESVGFVYKNIQVGVSHERGGSNLPEYPEKLIREVVNNALAHRDYSVDKFVNINIKPNLSIEIRNPGSFRQEQQIVFDSEKIKVRRLIPLAKARNPRLADILKVFDKWEGRGIGMASLTNACLDNKINVPYYLFHSQQDISLVIPKGQVLDDEAKLWLDGFSKYVYEQAGRKTLTEEEQIVLSYLYKCECLNRRECYTVLLTADNNHFAVISDLEEKGLIFKHPQSPAIYPIYLVHRTLTKTEFGPELGEIFGGHYDMLSNDYKKVLNAIHLYNQFSLTSVTANSVSTYIYLREHIRVTDLEEYNRAFNYKRKVRSIFNNLEEKGFIINQSKDKKKRPKYVINVQPALTQHYLEYES